MTEMDKLLVMCCLETNPQHQLIIYVLWDGKTHVAIRARSLLFIYMETHQSHK